MLLKWPFPILTLFILLAACGQSNTATPQPTTTEPAPINTATPIIEAPTAESPTAESLTTESATEAPPEVEDAAPTAVSQPAENPTPFAGWPEPEKTLNRLSRESILANQQATYQELSQNDPPARDDIQLAQDFRGVTVSQDNVPVVTEPLPVGTQQAFFISDIGTNERRSPDFELKFVSEHAYFWFDTTEGLVEPASNDLETIGAAFDQIHADVTFFFGPEDNPGIDGDPRIHIVNVSPLTLCGSSSCGVLGYVDSSNFLPQEAFPTSNAKEMFIMNGSIFGGSTYLDVLAHEFRHMIEDNYDTNDQDWEVEGSAMLAEDLLGYSSDPISRGNLFLNNPDQQLNRWTDGNSIPYYGQGYVLNRYIFNRLGEDLYRDFATHPLTGFNAIDAIAQDNNLGFTGHQLWQDWLASLAIHTHPNVPEQYFLRDGLNRVSMSSLSTFPYAEETAVSQFAADYYELEGTGTATLTFIGSNHVSLLPVQAPSGAYMWLADRANNSQMQLMRQFDLTAVSSATLQFDLYQDIEYAYDYTYLSISTDGGASWVGLQGAQAQSRVSGDDPSGTTYTSHFYTGRNNNWVQETVDLTSYAGQTVWIRFDYITDPILTFGGFAIDNIAIPEIEFYDDAEADTGWIANGFVRATSYIPQQWHLQLIRFEKDVPIVMALELSEENTAIIDIPLTDSGGGRPILIVSASAPMTLQPAIYELNIDN